MSIAGLKALVQDDLAAVDGFIMSKIQIHGGLIDELAQHLFQSGGKRIRPLIVLLSSHACHYQGTDHIKLAALIECFHTATLLHDDVIDESTLRRGRETANEIWGSKASILVGDYLVTQYMQLMLEVGNFQIIRSLTDMAEHMTRAEIKQLYNRHNDALSIEEYFDVIKYKTSILFALSAQLGAFITESPPEIEQSLYAYGLHLGHAFQLVDDALDYCSNADAMGKNIGDDLADGKVTLPLIYALQHSSDDQKKIIKTCLQQRSRENFPIILEAIKNTQAIEYTREIAEIETHTAINALKNVPDSVYKEALISIARYAISRES